MSLGRSRGGPQLLEQPTGETVKSDSENLKEFELTRNSERRYAKRGLERPMLNQIVETLRDNRSVRWN